MISINSNTATLMEGAAKSRKGAEGALKIIGP
jgi:hypothetical protein